jgi:hypothetical protein
MATAKKSKEPTIIEVPELDIRTITMRIVGTAPLVTHAWSEKAKRMMQEAQSGTPKQGGKKNREARDPQADYLGAMYLTDDGRPGIPARLFKAAAVAAANDVGAFKTTMRRVFYVEGTILLIEGDEPTMSEEFIRLESGVADIRYRPMWHKWAVTITVRYNASVITSAHLLNLFRTAGFACGVGEGRPNSPKGIGMGWGTFEVESMEGD